MPKINRRFLPDRPPRNTQRQLTLSEVATILHGLRMIQCEGRIEGCAAGDCEHFEEGAAALTNDEIDELCEAINCGQVRL
jgi:hypothetical protein